VNRFKCNLQYELLYLWFGNVQEIGEIFEKQENAERAMEYFDKAAELFSGEEVNSSGTQCKLKVAQFAAQLQQ